MILCPKRAFGFFFCIPTPSTVDSIHPPQKCYILMLFMFAYTHWLNHHRRMGVQSCMRLTCVSSTSVQVCRPIHHHLYSTRGNSGRCGRALFTLAMVFYKKWWVLREIESVRRYYKSEPTILPINQAARYLQRESWKGTNCRCVWGGCLIRGWAALVDFTVLTPVWPMTLFTQTNTHMSALWRNIYL